MSARLSNPLFSRTRGTGPSASSWPGCVPFSSCQNLAAVTLISGEEGDPVPRGSGSAQPSTSGKFLDRDVRVSPAVVQSQTPPFGGSGPTQSQLLPHWPRALFAASAALNILDLPLEEGRADRVSMLSVSGHG